MQQQDFAFQYLKRLVAHTVRTKGFFNAHGHTHAYYMPDSSYLCLIGNGVTFDHIQNEEVKGIVQNIERGSDVPMGLCREVDDLARGTILLVEMRYMPGHDAESDMFYRFVPHGVRVYDQPDELEQGLYIDDLFTRFTLRQYDGKSVLHTGGREMSIPDLVHIRNHHSGSLAVDEYYLRVLGARIAGRRDLRI